MKKAILVLIMLLCIATSAFAVTSKDLTGKTWIFSMEVLDDGTIIDNDTIMIEDRLNKTEFAAALKSITVGTPISYEKVSIYRLKLYPGKPDSTVIVYFDDAGYSLYGYIMPTKITSTDE